MIHLTDRKTFLPLILCAACLTLLQPVSATAQVNIFPGQNIQQVINGYPAGTQFYLKSGVHRMQSVTPRSGDQFFGEPGTVLSGARQLTAFSRSGSYWSVGSQTQEGAVNYSECRPDFPRCLNPENLFFNSVPLKHVDALWKVGPGTWFFDYPADRIYFWDDPTNQHVEISVTPVAFGGHASNVLLHGLIIEKYATPVPQAAVSVGTGWTLQYSEVRLNHYSGVSTYMNSVVRNSSIHHNGGLGMIGSGDNALIESNEISYNNFAGFNPFWGSGGSKWVLTTGLIVRNNFAHHNGGPGMSTDIGNIYTLYEGNTVEDNERGGIYHEISYDAVIRNNVARRNGAGRAYPWWTTGAGIEVYGSSNVEVYGNTVEDNFQGITGLDDHRGSGRYGPYVLRNLYVHDNLIISRTTEPGTGRTGVVDMDGYTAYAVGNNRFVNNSYVLGNPNGKNFMWLGERTMLEWQNYGHDIGAPPPAALPPTQGVRYLGDESFNQVMNGWGPAERNRSNGETGSSDGRTITLDGVTYAKGIGVHSDSQLYFTLNGQCTTFNAVIGVDDEVGGNGSVYFQVYVDDQMRYMSPLMTGSSPAQNVQVDISGATQIALYVHYGWDSYAYDHADWADARVTCR
jgi:parallel beta-helix repeat protein